MEKIFKRVQYSDYLGENRPILDTIVKILPDAPPPTPTPSSTVIPSPTPTPTPTPTPIPPGAVFNIGSGFDDFVNSVLIDPVTESIYVFGNFSAYNLQISDKMVKLDTSGDIDPGYVNYFDLSNTQVYDGIIDGDNLIMVGTFNNRTFDGAVVNRIVKVNKNTGSRDVTFDTTVSANQTVIGICQDGSQYIVDGAFTTYGGQPRNRIARINNDGTLDNTITFGTGPNTAIYKTIVNNAGNYVVVGAFITWNGATVNRVIEVDRTTGLDTGLFGSGFSGNVSDVVYNPSTDEYWFLTNDNASYQGNPAGQVHRVDGLGVELGRGNVQLGVVAHTLFYDLPNDQMYLGRISFGNKQFYKFDPYTFVKDATWEANIPTMNFGTSTFGVEAMGTLNNKYYMVGRFTIVGGENINHIFRANADGSSNTTTL